MRQGVGRRGKQDHLHLVRLSHDSHVKIQLPPAIERVRKFGPKEAKTFSFPRISLALEQRCLLRHALVGLDWRIRGGPIAHRASSRAVGVAVLLVLVQILLLALGTEVLKVDRHCQEYALQTRRDDNHPPDTPAFETLAGGQASRPEQTPGCLDAHHGNTQATHPTNAPGSVDLREVLYGSQDARKDSEEVGPSFECRRSAHRQGDGDDGCQQGVGDTGCGDGERGAVGWALSFGSRIGRSSGVCGRCGAGEVDHVEEETE